MQRSFFLDVKALDLKATLSPELMRLEHLSSQGFTLAPLVVVSAQLEEKFYSLNNLPQQLNRIFQVAKPKRANQEPDEDIVEDCCAEAQGLFKGHYLLDEMIDDFYDATDKYLPQLSKLYLRRPDEATLTGLQGIVALRGRPSLLALKELWLKPWQFAAVYERLKAGSIAVAARPVIIHNGQLGASEAQKVPNLTEKLWLDDVNRVLGVTLV